MNSQTEIADFRKILELALADGKSVMVGGHAVNFWALFYLPRIEAELRQFMPFTSKDLDFYGNNRLLETLRKNFGGMKRMSQPRGPVIGQVELQIDGINRVVEVLHSVHGLSQKELSHASAPILEVDRCKARVLDPVSLLKAKIHNAADFKQNDRNDVRHVKIMILCVREFMLDALQETKSAGIPQRNLINLLEAVRQVITAPTARKAEELWSLNYRDVWPLRQLKASGLTKITNFIKHRLPLI